MSENIRIYVASEPGNEKAEKALHWSVINTSTAPVDIYWMTDKYENSAWQGWKKRRDTREVNTGTGWKTNFSCFRWAIPEACKFKGKAIYLDVDQIILKDIKQMWNLPMDDYWVLSINFKRTDVMLMNCEKFTHEKWPSVKRIKNSGKSQLQHRKRVQKLGTMGPLSRIYNCLDGDGYNPEVTRLVHYTVMRTQPWHPLPQFIKYEPHPVPEVEQLWHEYYNNALAYEKANNVILGSPEKYDSVPNVIGNITSQAAKCE